MKKSLGGDIMGMYLNPGNTSFSEILDDDYVDKTGLIALINQRINKGTKRLVCISRPRRFGKSYTAQMLCAYYDHTCKSDVLFDPYEISKTEDYKKHMNQYQVIYLDMTQIMSEVVEDKTWHNIVSFIRQKITEELHEYYPDLKIDSAFTKTLLNAVDYSKKIVDSKEKKNINSLWLLMNGMHRFVKLLKSVRSILIFCVCCLKVAARHLKFLLLPI